MWIAVRYHVPLFRRPTISHAFLLRGRIHWRGPVGVSNKITGGQTERTIHQRRDTAASKGGDQCWLKSL